MSNKNEITSAKQLGDLLRSRRKGMGMTQTHAADLCNVGPRFIVELERGKETAQLGKILQVLRGYGLEFCVTPRKIGRR